MPEYFERHKELSKKVLIPDESKSSGQNAPGKIQLTPRQCIYPFSLGAIVGFFLFLTIWIIAGFSKLALMLPFIGGFFSVAIAVVRQKNKR